MTMKIIILLRPAASAKQSGPGGTLEIERSHRKREKKEGRGSHYQESIGIGGKRRRCDAPPAEISARMIEKLLVDGPFI